MVSFADRRRRLPDGGAAAADPVAGSDDGLISTTKARSLHW